MSCDTLHVTIIVCDMMTPTWGPCTLRARESVAWWRPVFSLKNDLSTGLTPGPVCAPVTLSVNLVVICSYLALCIVNRSTPLLSTETDEIRDITLNEMETGFLGSNEA